MRTWPLLLLLVFPSITAAPAAASDCPPDTLDLYGGPGTLEGKFQTAGGLPDDQGWTHRDDSVDADSVRWRISTYQAAGLDPGTPDNHAWWCGGDYPSCIAPDPDGGYGNGWDTRLAWTGAVDPLRAATVRVTGAVRHDSEPGYDFLSVEFVKAGAVVPAGAWDGVGTFDLDLAATYQPGEYLGDGGDSVRVQLRFASDGGWSDEDCAWPSAGAVQADNLQVTIEQEGDPAWSSPVETCEPGTTPQWRELPRLGVGDFAQLWTDLPELDPDRDNPSPQWAFLDDGIVVPGVGPTYVIDPAYPESTFAVNIGGGRLGPGHPLVNTLVSPPIALPESWCGALLVSVDAYFDTGECPPAYEGFLLAHTADPAGAAGWEEVSDGFVHYGTGRAFHRPTATFDQDRLPADTRWVRILLQARQLEWWCWEWNPLPGPYYDNVRLQLVPSAPSPVPGAPNAFTAAAAPNPFNPAVTVSWSLPRAGELDMRVYDLAGRLVRVLHDGPAAAGPGAVTWQGRDDAGRTLAAGVYVCRVCAGDDEKTLKLTLLK